MIEKEIILNELKKGNPIVEFISDYMKDHTYFTTETLTIYYIIEKLKKKNIVIEKAMYRFTSKYYSDYRKVKLSVSRELRRLKEKGIIESYSKSTYKVRNNVVM